MVAAAMERGVLGVGGGAPPERQRPPDSPGSPLAFLGWGGGPSASLACLQAVREAGGEGGGGALPWRWPSRAGSIEECEGIQRRECAFVCEPCARLALMRQLFVAGLSTSSGLVDSLT